MLDQIKSLHATWQRLTGQQLNPKATERLWYEFIQSDFTEDDLRCVIEGMKRHNTKGESRYTIQVHKVVGDLERFASLLADFRAKERNRPKRPSPAQAVLSSFRGGTVEKEQEQPVRSIRQIFKSL